MMQQILENYKLTVKDVTDRHQWRTTHGIWLYKPRYIYIYIYIYICLDYLHCVINNVRRVSEDLQEISVFRLCDITRRIEED